VFKAAPKSIPRGTRRRDYPAEARLLGYRDWPSLVEPRFDHCKITRVESGIQPYQRVEQIRDICVKVLKNKFLVRYPVGLCTLNQVDP
jgi:hypothetical protein